MPKVALITSVTGQDGYYLAELLSRKGYIVHSINRHSSLLKKEHFEEIYQEGDKPCPDIHIHYGDWSDMTTLSRLLDQICPDEIYNLGEARRVITCADPAEYPNDLEGIATLDMLEAIRRVGLEQRTRYYQAFPSGLYGLISRMKLSDLASSSPLLLNIGDKCRDYWATVNYREAFGMYACNGILFNNESPYRSDAFVTRKITRGLANITQGLQKCLYLGNLDAQRDWGHARDYAKMQWMMLQQDQPEDFVIATGVRYSVRQFVTFAALELGIKLRFEGKGVSERGIVSAIISPNAAALKVGDVIVAVDPRFIRHEEESKMAADPTKARKKLGWIPETSLQDLVIEMVQADLVAAKQRARLEMHS
ncbi:GDP-mannose 4,6-dehydratase [Rouxiella sp. Mn2063]|uniref:GDP-mannose 4,6-dehydratase n=1 Tax=Rouxiella sp. Mn2063 TaxID=3395262 RepID=UPI003BC59985